MAHLSTRRSVMGGLSVLLTLSLLSWPDLARAQSVTGSYRAEGRNPDGSAYSGRVQISGTAEALVVEWQVANQRYTGKGSRNGDVIWIDWGQKYPVVYLRMPSGELHGTWANGRGLERLIP
ncbi:hypothetical protein [Pseudophaeobacter sp.]|uniref:LIC10280 family protein n=1 Tax=Pseudophaeobacter sp. TaxID=1971739 RepID=UPI003A97C419